MSLKELCRVGKNNHLMYPETQLGDPVLRLGTTDSVQTGKIKSSCWLCNCYCCAIVFVKTRVNPQTGFTAVQFNFHCNESCTECQSNKSFNHCRQFTDIITNWKRSGKMFSITYIFPYIKLIVGILNKKNILFFCRKKGMLVASFFVIMASMFLPLATLARQH